MRNYNIKNSITTKEIIIILNIQMYTKGNIF